MKLQDKFFSEPKTYIHWKIYDYHTGRKLCDDYGAELADDYYDYMEVKEIKLKKSKSGDYYRVTVWEGETFTIDSYKTAQKFYDGITAPIDIPYFGEYIIRIEPDRYFSIIWKGHEETAPLTPRTRDADGMRAYRLRTYINAHLRKEKSCEPQR